MVKIAVLDDYQGVAKEMADWSLLEEKANIIFFQDHLADPAALVERLKPFDILCVMRERTPLPRSILEQLPRLKLIASTGHRNASIDSQAAEELGITICHTRYTPHGAIELTWTLILALIRHLPQEVSAMRNGLWQTIVGENLQNKTLGILGLGRIGSAIAKIALAFEMNVLAWSESLTRERAEKEGASLVSKEELFRTSDIVSLHLVLSSHTKHIVAAKEINWMKPSAYLVNTARGPLVDEQALVDALKQKRIAGAALDVYDEEPLPLAHPFRSLDRLITTPHIGFVTKETYVLFYQDTVKNILDFLTKVPIL